MKNVHFLSMTLIATAVIAGCGSMSANNTLDQARADYVNAQSNSQVTSLAAAELKQASDSLDRANDAWNKRDDSARIEHLAYIARQRVAIAQETATRRNAEQAIATAGAERDRVRLEARTREADVAKRNAEVARRESDISRLNAEASQRNADASQRENEASRRNAEASRRQSEASIRDTEAAQAQAVAERLAAEAAQVNTQIARQQTQLAEDRSRQLALQLADLEAKKTERGMVITLGDVLFDTNRAELKAGGVRNVQKLAAFFKQYPQRKVLIEGYTDSTGSNDHNQVLSQDRAQSVRTALVNMGTVAERITARGYGESYPVGDNATLAGRQLNRRVEIIVSDDGGVLTPR